MQDNIRAEISRATVLVELSSVTQLISEAINNLRNELQASPTGTSPTVNSGMSEEERQQLQGQVETLTALNAKVGTLETTLNALQAASQPAETPTTELSTLTNEIHTISTQLTALQTALTTETTNRTTANTQLSGQIDTINQTLEALNRQLSTLETTPANQPAVSATLSEEDRTTLAEVGNLSASITHSHKRSTKVFTRGKSLPFYSSTAGNNAVTDSPFFRIPAHVITPDGVIIVTADYRDDPGDQVKIGIAAALSYDGGATWEYAKCVDLLTKADGSVDSRSRIMDSTLLATASKKVFLLAGGFKQGTANWTRGGNEYNLGADGVCRVILAKTDHTSLYKTWTQEEITIANLPANTKMLIGGVGSGIEMENQLIFPVQYTTGNGHVATGIIVSNDDGRTWSWGGTGRSGASENMVCQYPEESGQLLAIGRVDGNRNRGVWQYSAIGQAVTSTNNDALANILQSHSTTACQGSTISFTTQTGRFIVLTSIPQNRVGGYNRDRITLYYLDVERHIRYPLLVVGLIDKMEAKNLGKPYTVRL